MGLVKVGNINKSSSLGSDFIEVITTRSGGEGYSTVNTYSSDIGRSELE